MLAIPSQAKLFLCNYPVNIGKSFEGLSAIVLKLFPGELLSGAFFIFINRRRDRLKLLTWDGDGYIIWYKRLERGSFSMKNLNQNITRKELFMLLEGIIPKQLNKRFKII